MTDDGECFFICYQMIFKMWSIVSQTSLPADNRLSLNRGQIAIRKQYII